MLEENAMSGTATSRTTMSGTAVSENTTPDSPTILHVDDNEANRYVVTRILQNAGFTVVEAATGAAGLQAIAQHQPALVILDVKLPDASGFEVCQQIKSNPKTASIPVLHLSATYIRGQDKAEGLDSGADAYLAQPVEPIELLATVRSLLRIRRAEEAALVSAQEWQTTFDSIKDGVCLVDRDGKILRCNQAMQRLFCKPFHEILGCAYHELTHTELGIGDGTCLRRAKETCQRQTLELQAGGRWFAKTIDPVLDEYGTFTGAVFILADITDRKQTEAALSEGEQQLKLALKTGRLGSWQLDLNTLELSTSEQCKANFGLSPDNKFLHQQLLGMIHPEDRDWVQAAFETAIATQTEYDVEYRTVWMDGSAHWALVRGRCFYDAVGTPIRMVGMSMDITDRKQAEAEREQLLAREQAAREQAETANRIKDEFLAVLSHELRSPLNPILGWAKILQTKQQDAAKTQYVLETIERNAKLQAQLIEDLLDVSRILQGKLSLNTGAVGLSFTIKAALETVRLAAEAKSIQIQTLFAPNVGQVLGDSGRLQQVVWNLLSNAIKFTPQGGRVEVRLEQIGNGETPNHSPLPTPYSHSYAQITVTDTGKGIAPDFLPHVFDYFRQADSTTTRKFGGLGLGLAIVRHLVELHGGTVEAASPGEGQGATFIVKLPVMVVASANPNDASSLDRLDFNLNGLQVLFVDDDRDSREYVVFLLEQYGAKVTEVGSAHQALSQLQQAEFDLLISDVGMPDMDGYALVHQIREQQSEQNGKIPAIALTAYAGELNQQHALAAGFQQHVTKPIEPEVLIQTIWALVDKNTECL